METGDTHFRAGIRGRLIMIGIGQCSKPRFSSAQPKNCERASTRIFQAKALSGEKKLPRLDLRRLSTYARDFVLFGPSADRMQAAASQVLNKSSSMPGVLDEPDVGFEPGFLLKDFLFELRVARPLPQDVDEIELVFVHQGGEANGVVVELA
jgi:hypothetical protein